MIAILQEQKPFFYNSKMRLNSRWKTEFHDAVPLKTVKIKVYLCISIGVSAVNESVFYFLWSCCLFSWGAVTASAPRRAPLCCTQRAPITWVALPPLALPSSHWSEHCEAPQELCASHGEHLFFLSAELKQRCPALQNCGWSLWLPWERGTLSFEYSIRKRHWTRGRGCVIIIFPMATSFSFFFLLESLRSKALLPESRPEVQVYGCSNWRGFWMKMKT